MSTHNHDHHHHEEHSASPDAHPAEHGNHDHHAHMVADFQRRFFTQSVLCSHLPQEQD